MNDYTGWESSEDVMATARSAGFEPSEKQRKDWRRAGLLPRPVDPRGAGRGQGTALYPPGTGALLSAICRHSERKKPLRDVALLVWWDGCRPADMTALHAAIRRVLDDWERWIAPWGDLDTVPPQQWREVDRALRSRRQPTLLRTATKRSGQGPAREVIAALLNMAAGGFTGFRAFDGGDAEDAQSDMAAALATDQARWIAGEIAEPLAVFSAIIRPADLRAAFEDASDDELESARDEVREIVSLIDSMSRLAAMFSTNEDFAPFEVMDSASLTPGMLAMLTLFWLSARKHPTMQRNYAVLRPAIETVSALHALFDAMKPGDTKKLARRLQPSASVADGEDSSTCTKILAPSPPPRSGMGS